MEPNFSAYPFERLRKLTRQGAQIESTLAHWIAARSRGERLSKLVGAPKVEVVALRDPFAPRDAAAAFDPFAARCEVRTAGAAIEVRGSSLAVRAIAQRLVGGPAELAAPRPLGVVEKSLFTLVVATALEDLGVAGEVWPILDDDLDSHHDGLAIDAPPRETRFGHAGARSKHRGLHVHSAQGHALAQASAQGHAHAQAQASAHPNHASDQAHERTAIVELAVTLGDIALAVQLRAAPELLLRAAPVRALPRWFDTTMIEAPIVLGRCALASDDLARLAVRSVITLERPTVNAERPAANAAVNAELHVLGGAIGLAAAQQAVVAEVATGYVARDMSLPDQAHVELTVALGTTQLSLRQVSELAIGQIIQLGRPLAGPFELRAAGRVVGRGELVDVDGELAVRIVSLGD
jgi:flagellar motor switch/type III secretory pathway protein FliN